VITRKEWLRARERPEARLEGARKRLHTNSPAAALEGLSGDPGAFDGAWSRLGQTNEPDPSSSPLTISP
jgi:hypothetical protein